MRKNCPRSATELVLIIYGRVEVARSATSQNDDLFGPVMNMCSKINSKALSNGIAIGDKLYKIIQSFSSLSSLENRYHFEEIS
jgi:two-component system, OmpR family, response regulator ChvI